MDESESTMTGTTGRTQRVEPGHQDGVDAAAILADNQALMQRLQKTHGKLKVAKARIAQLEASLQWANQVRAIAGKRGSSKVRQAKPPQDALLTPLSLLVAAALQGQVPVDSRDSDTQQQGEDLK